MAKVKEAHPPCYRTRTNVALIVFLGIAGYFLFTEHLAHLVQSLPYVLLLVFLAIHIYMHWGRGDSNVGHGDDRIESAGDNHGR